jgi:hypothetical protein
MKNFSVRHEQTDVIMNSDWVQNHINGIPQPTIDTPGWKLISVAGDTSNDLAEDCTAAVVKFHGLNIGYIPFVVALGIRMNARAIIMRNNRGHTPVLGNLPPSIIMKLIELLGKGDANIRGEMQENGLNLLVRYNLLHDLQGTPFCNTAKEREYTIIKSFYSRAGNCLKINSKVPLAVDRSEYDNSHRLPILCAQHLMNLRRRYTSSSHEELLDAGARALLPPAHRLVSVPRDGHCMFRALAICLSHLATNHHAIRKTIITHILGNWENSVVSYAEWIRYEHPNETPVTYKRRMLGRSKDWGDHPELVAAAEHYGHHVVVLEYAQDATSFREIIVHIPKVEFQNAPRIILIRVGRNHYHAGNCTT